MLRIKLVNDGKKEAGTANSGGYMRTDRRTGRNQITSGICSVLSRACVYDAFQNLMGGRNARKSFAELFIRAKSGDHILDVGCGTAQILQFLPEGVHYWGYDIDSEYIAAATRRFGSRGHFSCREFTMAEMEKLPKIDIVLASGLIHHLDDAQVIGFLRLAQATMRDGARLVSIDPCFAPGQNPVARFLASHDRGLHVRTEEENVRLAESIFKKVIWVVRHTSWIPYTHVIMECH